MKKYVFLLMTALIISACSSDTANEEEAVDTPETTVADDTSETNLPDSSEVSISVESIVIKNYEGDVCSVYKQVEKDYFIVYGYADMTNAPKVLDYSSFDEWVSAYQNFQSDDPDFENVLTMVNKLTSAKEEAKAANCPGIER